MRIKLDIIHLNRAIIQVWVIYFNTYKKFYWFILKFTQIFRLKFKCIWSKKYNNLINMNSYWNNHSSQRHGQKNEQKVIQDQNFSNEIFFGILSTIESIVQYY